MNAFIGKVEQPTDAELAAALGRAKAAWDRLLADLSAEYGVNDHEWKCYSPKHGWSLRVKQKSRTIVWLTPSRSSFDTVFILGDKAMRAARQIDFPEPVLDAIQHARKYPEGTSIRLEVKSTRTIGPLKKLAEIKLAR